MMKSELKVFISSILIALFVVSCGGDYRRTANGSFGELIVVMDSSKWQSPTADAIRNTFGGGIETLPRPEPRFDLKFVDFRTQEKLDNIKKMKNIIFAAPIDEKTSVGAFIRGILGDQLENQVRNGDRYSIELRNKWYKDQWTMLLTSTSQDTLAARINRHERTLTASLHNLELNRWTDEIYHRGEQVQLEDTLWNEHGWKFRIQHDYQKHIDTTNFVTFRRYMGKNDRWIWVWWKNNFYDIGQVDKDWINAKRDSLTKEWIRGSRDSSYVTTEYKKPVNTHTMMMNGYYTFESKGVWRMTHDFMGGPFVNYTIYDDKTNRLFMIEFAQFAPKYSKRRFVRQFEAMGRTFVSDSTYVPGSTKEDLSENRITNSEH